MLENLDEYKRVILPLPPQRWTFLGNEPRPPKDIRENMVKW